jgi:hypothetical protein
MKAYRSGIGFVTIFGRVRMRSRPRYCGAVPAGSGRLTDVTVDTRRRTGSVTSVSSRLS